MEKTTFKLVVIGILGYSGQIMSLGFETLPITGFSVASGGSGSHQPVGGVSQYRLCNTTGNYGSLSVGASLPTTTANNTCALVPAPPSILSSPESGFFLIASANRSIIMSNALTGGSPISIGNLADAVFRNPTKGECIYAAQVSLATIDYDITRIGTQFFHVNGVARGGFASSGEVSAGYARVLSVADVVYRIGRTYTSVQHRAASLGSGVFALGYYNQPLISAVTTSINGQNTPGLGVPSASEQSANQNANWVEFTTNFYSADSSTSSTSPGSPAFYVRAACSSTPPITTPNAIRLRQTWRDQGSFYEFIEVRVDGFVPVGANANPLPVPGSTY